MWMVSLQAEITTCSRPPQQALLYLQNKKLLGFERRGERDPAENHPLVQVVNTLCCWLCVWGREEGSSWSGSLVGGCWSRLDKCPPPRCLGSHRVRLLLAFSANDLCKHSEPQARKDYFTPAAHNEGPSSRPCSDLLQVQPLQCNT